LAKEYTVVKIDSIKKDIKGKSCDCLSVVLKNDTGNIKKEEILSFAKTYSAAAVLNVGDLVSCTWEKKTVGDKDYFNLSQITKISGGSSTAGATPSVSPASPPKSTGGGGGGYGKNDPDVQLSIARQNVNNVAMNFVMGMLSNGVYDKKKTTPDLMFEEIKRFAKKFEAFVTLKDDYSQLAASARIEGLPEEELDGMLD